MNKIILGIMLTLSISFASSNENNKLNIKLHKAIYENAPVQQIESLINQGADINFADKMGTTPLVKSIVYNRKDVFKLFINKGIDLKGRAGFSTLKVAVLELKFNYFKLLIDNGADINFNDYNGNTILHLMASGIVEKKMDALKGMISQLRKGSYRDSVQNDIDNMEKDWKNYEKILTFIIQNSKSPYVKNYDEKTPLKLAEENNTSQVIKILKALNIDSKITSTLEAKKYVVNKKEITKEFLLAINEKAPIDILEYMIDNGANINARDYSNWTPLMRAIETDRTDLALLLIKKGADINLDIKGNNSIAYNAAYRGNIPVLKLLIEKGTNPNLINNFFGDSLLHSAVNGNQKATIETLIQLGANVNIKEKTYMKTPLHNACDKGLIEIVKILLKNGANINAKDKYGNTPLYYAIRFGKNEEELIKFLLKNKANINNQDNNGRTVLYEAIFTKNIKYNIVNLLVKNGANINVKDKMGMVLLDIVKYQKKDDTRLMKILTQ
ncbi:MAG: ankyrin repeat domain-containing protein [Sulfurimonas sp.]|jgi:ankyrin repeat protein|nr:ankyrin repeat domain-containing protein [Sulfurimonas sp.]